MVHGVAGGLGLVSSSCLAVLCVVSVLFVVPVLCVLVVLLLSVVLARCRS